MYTQFVSYLIRLFIKRIDMCFYYTNISVRQRRGRENPSLMPSVILLSCTHLKITNTQFSTLFLGAYTSPTSE